MAKLKRKPKKDDTAARVAKGLQALREKRLEDARAHCMAVLEENPNQPDALRVLGLLLVEIGKVSEAATLLQRAVTLSPGSALLRNDLAVAWFRLGRLEDCHRELEQALALQPDYGDALANMGKLQKRLGDLPASTAAFRKAVEALPEHVPHRVALGEVLLDHGDVEEAKAAFAESVRRDPTSARAQLGLARALHQAGRPHEASDAFQAAIRLKPDSAEAFYGWGAVLAEGGDHASALELLEQALRLRAHHVPSLVQRGLVLAHLGRRDEALESLRAALERDPSNLDARHMLASLSGESLTRADDGYVRNLFDSYASRFDEHLTQHLGYDAPQRIAQLLEQLRPAPGVVLDLGCGTGLCAPGLRPHATRLVGVDLSSRMLERARETGLFDELRNASLEEVLDAWEEPCTLMVAAEVLVYVGDPAPLMTAARRVLAPGGRLVVTVEDHEGEGFVLQQSSRFAHSAALMRSLAAEHGLSVEVEQRFPLRKHQSSALEGILFVFRQPG